MRCKLLLRGVVLTLLAVGAVLVSSPAQAHRLNVFAYVVGDEVNVEVYFSDGARAKGAEMTVYTADEKELLTGRTDDDGMWVFPAEDVTGDLEIVAETQDGHKGRCTLKAEELAGATPGAAPAAAAAASTTTRHHPHGEMRRPASAAGDLDEIRASLEQIDASLRSVQRELAELRRPRAGPSLDSVLAGVGFIVGLTGVAMYFMARNAAKK
jgi:nickel transport protein